MLRNDPQRHPLDLQLLQLPFYSEHPGADLQHRRPNWEHNPENWEQIGVNGEHRSQLSEHSGFEQRVGKADLLRKKAGELLPHLGMLPMRGVSEHPRVGEAPMDSPRPI
jgi:hypothetical protein